MGFPAVGIAVTPDAQNVYTANVGSANVSGFAVADGALSQLAGSPLAAGANSGPLATAPSPDGRYLYVPNAGPGFGINPNFASSVSAYAVDADGKLTEVASSPFSVAPRNYPLNIAISPDGRHLFVATIGTNSVSVFAIGADGALSQIPGSPFPIGGTNPFLKSIANTPNQPPTASFTMQIRPAGFPTSFDGSGSSDPDGSMVGYD